ncbi:hypothetical protein KCG48_13445 [Proteiniclasticum sp. BAD-10]|uniref:YCII-related domain-containing protein n=1 Tax=Proteiniclasticum sediminis TaxID=2804028 RepID=A0A941HSK0_9CLOT|nr:YciI family protein [Proteiniclasticum sediminis]MBR0577317.1 hypothetical protein [Proteiniclasticum sediminis]
MEFIYTLKLREELRQSSNWPQADDEAVDAHFEKLKAMLANGKLILAGRTPTMDEDTFGIVIFKADSLEEATRIMKEDPAVMQGTMSARVYPFRTALLRGGKRAKGIVFCESIGLW